MTRKPTDPDTYQPVLCSKGHEANRFLFFPIEPDDPESDIFFQVQYADQLVIVAMGDDWDSPDVAQYPEDLDRNDLSLVCSCGEFVPLPAGCRAVADR